MPQSHDVGGAPLLGFEAWRALLRTICGRYNPEGIDPKAFLGWVHPLNICGLAAVDIGWNALRVERTDRDVRLDGMAHYCVMFQVAGKSGMTQNDRAVQLSPGDVALVDAARPVTYFASDTSARWLSVHLPRRSLISHLGFEPQGGSCGQGARATRLLFDLVRDADAGSASSSADFYMQLAVYDLVGALFAPSEPRPVSRATDKLFARIGALIKDGFPDADFGPVEVANQAGVSLRYVQRLFTERGTTCSEFIYSRRLDHAAHLLHRRALLGTGQPIGEIAYACGFREYAHFARRFRNRFGYPPGSHGGHGQIADDGTVRAGTGKSALSAHDVQFRAS
jgi:AraC-like DNA-binding protein